MPAIRFEQNQLDKITLARVRGVRFACLILAVVLTAFATITLPFYLYDPAGFSPLRTIDKSSLQSFADRSGLDLSQH